MKSYDEFLKSKQQYGTDSGFEPLWIPDFLFPFQRDLVAWAIRKGRAALFCDCGLGKTPMQLVWAQNIVQKTNGRILILTPLAVAAQTEREGEKFDIPIEYSKNAKTDCKIVATNYERLSYFDPKDFVGCVCDESSILKNFNGARKTEITEFMRKMPYRLLCTATAAPNDYIELGTSSEALGYLGHMDMLNRFFKNDQNNSSTGRYHGQAIKWRFKGHAELPFWKWVASWARAVRKPSDIGHPDGDFVLPELIEKQSIVKSEFVRDGFLFSMPVNGLVEEREERRKTISERCGKVADIVNKTKDFSLVWCHMNDEGDLLEKLIPDSIQVSGGDQDDSKEEKLLSFAKKQSRVLITKPKIGAWGLNFQHCNHITFFPSHSYEQYYQGVRRCWRFGQKRKVVVDIVTTEGEKEILANLQRKSHQADRMFERLVSNMHEAIGITRENIYTNREEIPKWLTPISA